MSRPRLCFVTAVPMTVTAFLNVHIERLADDFDVYVISDFSGGEAQVSARAKRISLPLARAISPWRDLLCLWMLFRTFRQYRFDAVHSVTPKAGLLAMLAGFLARTPVRIHWFTGQVWVTRRGVVRALLKNMDRLLAVLATHLLADSPSQREFLVHEKIVRAGGITVIAQGSICGVDTQRFCPDAVRRERVRESFGIPAEALLVLFLGRLNGDKGLYEMAQAMRLLDPVFPQVHWLFVGPDEGGQEALLRRHSGVSSARLHFQGYTAEPEAFMAAADLFCLPSYREGFGSSALEAAAAGVPVVATQIYGLVDAVENDVTGVLVPAHDGTALAQALQELLQNPSRRRSMGEAGRSRAMASFSRERVVAGLVAYYRGLGLDASIAEQGNG